MMELTDRKALQLAEAGTLAGIGVSLYSLHAENQRYKRAARRQKVHQPPKNTVKSGRKAG